MTNLGGVAALPVTVPANLAGVAVVQVRMVAAIAHLRGYDLDDNRVRTALVMCLLGGEQVAKQIAEGTLPTSPMAVATAPMFDPELDRQVAEEVAGDLAARVGGKNMALLRDQAGAAARRRHRRRDGRVATSRSAGTPRASCCAAAHWPLIRPSRSTPARARSGRRVAQLRLWRVYALWRWLVGREAAIGRVFAQRGLGHGRPLLSGIVPIEVGTV